jgi:hypothetical protein
VDASGALTNVHASRTAKSCGPDAPTLASSGDNACALRLRRWQESPVTGESTKETVKTIARGMPGVSGCSRGDDARVLFHFARGAAGAVGARHSLRLLIQKVEGLRQKLARKARRDRGCVGAAV